ncbi:MAG: amidohydrolase family protein [Chromatiales bacterium]|nr:amidohydrolase family protein [Chromatiales bacterium]
MTEISNFLRDIPIVDAHHHLWDLDRHHYPWLGDRMNPHFFLGDYSALRRNYLPQDYRRDAAGHNVVATVHVEAEWDRADQVGETRWLSAVADVAGMPAALVGHAWFDDPRVEAVLEAHAAYPRMRGIRSKPARPGQAPGDEDEARGSMRDPAWRRGFALLARHGLSWDLRVPLAQLAEAAELVGAHPDIAVVLNHTGFPWDRSAAGLEAWRRGMRTLAERPNVCLKLSELGLRDRPWDYEENRRIVLEAIDLFGVDRCMFASNFPVSGLRITYRELYDAYKRMVADLAPAEQLALFHDNAARFYRIDTSAAATTGPH